MLNNVYTVFWMFQGWAISQHRIQSGKTTISCSAVGIIVTLPFSHKMCLLILASDFHCWFVLIRQVIMLKAVERYIDSRRCWLYCIFTNELHYFASVSFGTLHNWIRELESLVSLTAEHKHSKRNCNSPKATITKILTVIILIEIFVADRTKDQPIIFCTCYTFRCINY